MTSLPLESTQGRQRCAWNAITALEQQTRSATLFVACHHRLWIAHTITRSRAWNDITAFGQHTQPNDVRSEMPSPPLDSTHGRTTLGVACHHHVWAAHTVERRRASHAIITFGKNKRLNDVGRGITSPPLDSTHGRQRRTWHAITAL